MTHVINTAAASFNANILMEYMIEVVTFNGDSEIVYVEAHSTAEAQELAAARIPDADYSMVQGCWVA